MICNGGNAQKHSPVSKFCDIFIPSIKTSWPKCVASTAEDKNFTCQQIQECGASSMRTAHK